MSAGAEILLMRRMERRGSRRDVEIFILGKGGVRACLGGPVSTLLADLVAFL